MTTPAETELTVTAGRLARSAESVRTDEAEAERRLIERARDEPSALAQLYRMHQARISVYVLRRLGDVHEAEDVVANVFLAMVRHLAKYRCRDAPLITWLYRVATNEINRHLRRGRVRRCLGLTQDVPGAAQTSVDDADEVRTCLLKLPAVYQDVLSLHYLEELSIEEVSCVLGVAIGTVKSRLARGRHLLREHLSPSPR